MENYIGLDAHSATCTFVNVNNKGEIISQCCVKTTEKNLLGFVRIQKGFKKLTFEESNLSQWLYVLLKTEVDELVVCNARYLSEKQGPKTDYRDAIHLANELRTNHLIPVFHEENDFIKIRSQVGAYNDVVREIARTKNRYKALFRSQALHTEGTKIYSEPERIEELTSSSDRFVAHNLLEQLRCLNEIKQKYLSLFKENTKIFSQIKKLTTIPGIDIVRSNIIAAIICSAQRFKNKHKLWAYSMLVKYIQESGGKTYGQKMVQGRRELKCVYVGAAQSVLQHGNSSLKQYYDRLRSKGVDHDMAKFDVARKIAAISLSILKHNKPYDDHYEEKKERINKKSH